MGRELRVSRLPTFLSKYHAEAHRSLSYGAARHFHVGDRHCRHRHWSACRVLRSRRGFYSGPGPCLYGGSHNAYRCGNGPTGDSRVRRLWGYETVMSGNVDMIAVFFMIIGAMFGAQFGSIATSFVRGPAIRYILSYSLILATTGAFLRLYLHAHCATVWSF